MPAESGTWRLRKGGGGAVYGPVPTAMLAAWAREGRIAPEDEISADGLAWQPAHTLEALRMRWWLRLPDGSWFGPAHIDAFREIVAEHGLPPGVTVREGPEGAEVRLDEVRETSGSPTASASASRSVPDEERLLEELQRALGVRRPRIGWLTFRAHRRSNDSAS